MKKSINLIKNYFAVGEKAIDSISRAESQAISSSFSIISEYSPELFKSKVYNSQKRITNKILADDFIKNICSDEKISLEKLNFIKFNFRQINSPLSIPFPAPNKQLRNSAVPILALSGTVIGMFLTAFLFRFFIGNDYRQFGIIIGASVGAFLFSLLGIYLSKREILLRFLQGLFGVAIATELFTLFTGAVNPVSILWRKLTGRFGNNLWGKLKRIITFTFGILLLQIAVPETKIPKEELKLNTYFAIKSWLEQSLKILILVINEANDSISQTINSNSEKTDIQLLKSLVKLINSRDTSETNFIKKEVVLSFKNAGYEVKSKYLDKYPAFSEIMKNEFDIEGYIDEGDNYKIFEMPLYKNDELIIRGKLTKIIIE
ncbi:MAG: hypothetical protein DRI44_00675 [Chlamydiae bacterium]|nr:MAG: hypothetical protein DRI44_00675 [Chlamydiota bacterium]